MKHFILLFSLFCFTGAIAQSDSSMWAEKKPQLGNLPMLHRIPCEIPKVETWNYSAAYKEELPDSLERIAIDAFGVPSENFKTFAQTLAHRSNSTSAISGYSAKAQVEFDETLVLNVLMQFDSNFRLLNVQEIESVKAMASRYDQVFSQLQQTVSDPDSVVLMWMTYDCESKLCIYNFDLTEEVIRKGPFSIRVRSQTIVIQPEENGTFDISRTTMEFRRPKRQKYRP